MEVEHWARTTPGLFSDFGDMGPVNYLVHAKAQRDDIRVGAYDLQQIPDFHGSDELIADCSLCAWRFPRQVNRPRIVHFCGRKPYLFDRSAYSRPFTIARLEHHRKQHGEAGAWLAVLQEDGRVVVRKAKRRLRRLLGRSAS